MQKRAYARVIFYGRTLANGLFSNENSKFERAFISGGEKHEFSNFTQGHGVMLVKVPNRSEPLPALALGPLQPARESFLFLNHRE